MNAAAAPRHVTLVVNNPDVLQHGSTPRHRFDRMGGTIGCRGANWILIDREGRIEPIHCEICLEDGHFCVVDRSGLTHINGAQASMGRSVGARLCAGDALQVGPYELIVHLGNGDDALFDAGVDDGIGEQWGHLQRDGADLSPVYVAPTEAHDGLAIFQGLATSEGPREDLDPLYALELAERQAKPPMPDQLDMTHYGLAPAKPQADLGATRFEAVSGAPNITSGETTMPASRTDTTQAQHWLSAQSSSGGDPRQLIAPLTEGLDASLGLMDGQTAYRLLLEAGQALHATIAGLTALYRTTAGGEDRLALLGRTLQPIEDNPLRLGLNYEDTVRALFGSERSVVHLSPTAAVEESLTQVRRHQAAIAQAINEGLHALLRSFSPEVLLQRFQRYRPDPAQPAGAGDWAWQMYTHYYNELASSRQLGFEKLFWEVFEQAYDRALRVEVQ